MIVHVDVHSAGAPYARRRARVMDVHVDEPTAVQPHTEGRNRRSPDNGGAATPPHQPDREDHSTGSPSPETPNPTPT